ncbi:serine/threonine-protein kinase CTR1 isoform X2 [Magnolia sinica]|uniref:serine/threonine-protein kinase CTR1 isoform X2 n=1 Tax=Magnolia sinica TaxID=86752 RepID=UPI0026597439|nr:serine/threonine-protein kinase CTR1 isoform X2 [Magnolia sinica]
MEMPGRRSNYSLLSQFPDDLQQQQSKFPAPPAAAAAPFYESLSGEKNKQKPDRPFDWPPIDGGDHRRVGSFFPPSIGLQRQSSGSSFGESSLSGEYYVSTLSTANDPDLFPQLLPPEDGFKTGADARLKAVDAAAAAGSSSSKSRAQQTEESYQLQLALALRLSSEATCADDPNFLCPGSEDSSIGSPIASSESVSHRFWVNGCLSYYDKVPDGFYLIQGMDPYVWTVCTDLQENGRIPSIESLKAMSPSDSSVEVVLIDKRGDPGLKELENKVVSLSCGCFTTKEVVDELAKLICRRMGGAASAGEGSLVPRWQHCSDTLKDCLGSIVFPVGSLSVGLCRHRALLFKVLADAIDLPCRIAKGCKYCRRDDATSCLVRFGFEREYLVDLIGNPGSLCEPDSLLNGPSSILISSPLRLPRFKTVGIAQNFRSLAKQYFSDCQSLNLIFDDASAGSASGQGDATDPSFPGPLDRKHEDMNYSLPVSINNDENSLLPKPNQGVARPDSRDDETQFQKWQNSQNGMVPQRFVEDHSPKNVQRQREIPPMIAISNPRTDKNKELRLIGSSQVVPKRSDSELSLEVDDLDIPWSDLVLKERIGAGSFGTVHRADWHGSEVAVKILMEQDFHAEKFKEFLREVAIMKRLRHPNIVLFMGAVTRPPNLSIVTEYLSRGSLYRLLHRPGAREMLDERRRLNMAYDVAKGMNYLHKRNPPIVHRDLKSPNLLVDRKYTVKSTCGHPGLRFWSVPFKREHFSFF